MAAAAQTIELHTELPEGYGYLYEPHRYKVAHGGRGSTKSWSYARALIGLAYQRKLRVLCARELQTSISESVHRLLADQIDLMGLGRYFEVQQQGIYGTNGSEFFFYGIRNNITKVKSAEGIDICWCEEAEKISDNSWQVLIPTIRKAGSEIWITFNPDEEMDPTFQRFVVQQNALPGNSVVRQFNWQQNPWWWTDNCKPMRDEKDYLYRVDPEAAAHVWGGECRRNASSQIFRGKYVVENFTAPVEAYDRKAEGWDGPYYGADWGFSQDPACLVRCWIKGYAHGKTSGKLMVDYDEGGVGIELDDLPRAFARVPGYKDYAVRGDSSRPETISHVARHGAMNIRPSEKWKGCVEDGVAYLRSFEQIVVHPRCEATQQEMRLYSYKVDRLTGDVTADIVDKHNHRIDALRYALEPLIMASRSTGAWGRLQG